MDVRDREELTRVLLGHCDRVAARLRTAGLAAGGVTLKLRLPDFSLRTRSRAGLRPTQLAPRLFAAARALLGGAAGRNGLSTDRRRRDRSRAGVERPTTPTSSTATRRREKSREAAIAALRDKFGAGAVERGLAFRAARPKR